MIANKVENILIVIVSTVGILLGIMLFLAAKERSRTITELREAYETIASDSNPTIICRNGKIKLFNRAAEEATGLQTSNVIGKETSEILIPLKYRQRHYKAIESLKLAAPGTSGVQSYILPITNKIGITRKWLVVINYRIDMNGALVTTARFVDYNISDDKLWLDVEKNALVKVRLVMEDQ